MGIEDFEEFYRAVEKEMNEEGIIVNPRILRNHLTNIDEHGPNIGRDQYGYLVRAFVMGVYYSQQLDVEDLVSL